MGRGKLAERLDEEAQKRVELLEGDVLKVTGDPVDAVLATNFSYYLFKTRSELKNYFATARKHIRPGNLHHGRVRGKESFEEQKKNVIWMGLFMCGIKTITTPSLAM